MATIYAAKTGTMVVGSQTYIVADGFQDLPHVTLMIDQARSNNCLVLSPVDTAVSPSLQALITAPTTAELKARIQAEKPTAQERRIMDRYATGGGQLSLTTEQQTWWECLEYLARQVNPVADLDSSFASFL